MSEILNIQLDSNFHKNISITNSQTKFIQQANKSLNDFDSFYDSIELHRAFSNITSDNQKYSLSRKRLIRKDMSKTITNYINQDIQFKLPNKFNNLFLNEIGKAQKYFDKSTKNYLNIHKLQLNMLSLDKNRSSL